MAAIRIDRRYEIWATDDVELPQGITLEDIEAYDVAANMFIYKLRGEEKERMILLDDTGYDFPTPDTLIVETIEED
jgi:hypothetical protein